MIEGTISRDRNLRSKRPSRDSNRGQKKDLIREVILTRRVSKTTARGRIRGVSILAIAGDGRGRIGWGIAGSKEIQTANAKAARLAEAYMKHIPIWNRRTLPHDAEASFGPVTVLIRKAKTGTGIIAGGVVKTVFEALGVKDVVAKVVRGNNPLNVLQALMKALESLRLPSKIASERGIS